MINFLVILIVAFCATAITHAAIILKGPSGAITKYGAIGANGQRAGFHTSDESKWNDNEIVAKSSLGPNDINGNTKPVWDNKNGPWKDKGVVVNNNNNWKGDNGLLRGQSVNGIGDWRRSIFGGDSSSSEESPESPESPESYEDSKSFSSSSSSESLESNESWELHSWEKPGSRKGKVLLKDWDWNDWGRWGWGPSNL